MTALAPGRIPCPDCGQPLALPIEAVLAGRAIVCGGCGLELQVNREDSKMALAALGRWYDETAPAREAAAAASSAKSPTVPEGSGRRRPRR
ncbi:MAG: hypothetical protein ACFB13_20045 [Kiloniellaceae bacterium]